MSLGIGHILKKLHEVGWEPRSSGSANSCQRICKFESHHRILEGSFVTLNCCTILLMYEKIEMK